MQNIVEIKEGRVEVISVGIQGPPGAGMAGGTVLDETTQPGRNVISGQDGALDTEPHGPVIPHPTAPGRGLRTTATAYEEYDPTPVAASTSTGPAVGDGSGGWEQGDWPDAPDVINGTDGADGIVPDAPYWDFNANVATGDGDFAFFGAGPTAVIAFNVNARDTARSTTTSNKQTLLDGWGAGSGILTARAASGAVAVLSVYSYVDTARRFNYTVVSGTIASLTGRVQFTYTRDGAAGADGSVALDASTPAGRNVISGSNGSITTEDDQPPLPANTAAGRNVVSAADGEITTEDDQPPLPANTAVGQNVVSGAGGTLSAVAFPDVPDPQFTESTTSGQAKYTGPDDTDLEIDGSIVALGNANILPLPRFTTDQRDAANLPLSIHIWNLDTEQIEFREALTGPDQWTTPSTGTPGTAGITNGLRFLMNTGTPQPTDFRQTLWGGDITDSSSTMLQMGITDANSQNIETFIANVMSSTSARRARITIRSVSNPTTQWLEFAVTSYSTTGTGNARRIQFVGSVIGRSTANLAHNYAWAFFSETGEKGDTGTGVPAIMPTTDRGKTLVVSDTDTAVWEVPEIGLGSGYRFAPKATSPQDTDEGLFRISIVGGRDLLVFSNNDKDGNDCSHMTNRYMGGTVHIFDTTTKRFHVYGLIAPGGAGGAFLEPVANITNPATLPAVGSECFMSFTGPTEKAKEIIAAFNTTAPPTGGVVLSGNRPREAKRLVLPTGRTLGDYTEISVKVRMALYRSLTVINATNWFKIDVQDLILDTTNAPCGFAGIAGGGPNGHNIVMNPSLHSATSTMLQMTLEGIQAASSDAEEFPNWQIQGATGWLK